MPNPRIVVLILSVAVMALSAGAASGQNYPNKPIRIVTSEAGAGNDYVARLIAQEISSPLGQPVIVENKRASLLSTDVVANAAPDGYTLLVNGSSFWQTPLLQKVSYDLLQDFSPISIATISPFVLIVRPSLSVTSVKELIALAKTKPGVLNYGTNGPGGSPHLAMELFKSLAGVNILHVPYKGGGQAIVGLAGDEVQMMFGTATLVTSHVQAGRARALAITSMQPSALVPGLPALAATLPGFEIVATIGIFAPAKTPVAVISRLNQEIVRTLNRADVKAKFFNSGSETVGSSPEQFTAKIKTEMAVMGKVIKDAGIRGE